MQDIVYIVLKLGNKRLPEKEKKKSDTNVYSIPFKYDE